MTGIRNSGQVRVSETLCTRVWVPAVAEIVIGYAPNVAGSDEVMVRVDVLVVGFGVMDVVVLAGRPPTVMVAAAVARTVPVTVIV